MLYESFKDIDRSLVQVGGAVPLLILSWRGSCPPPPPRFLRPWWWRTLHACGGNSFIPLLVKNRRELFTALFWILFDKINHKFVKKTKWICLYHFDELCNRAFRPSWLLNPDVLSSSFYLFCLLCKFSKLFSDFSPSLRTFILHVYKNKNVWARACKGQWLVLFACIS